MKLKEILEDADPYLTKVRVAAAKVRKSLEDDAEEYNISKGFPTKPDKQYKMDGLCAIASAKLHTELKDAGIKSTFLVKHDEGGHCYLVTDRGHIVDVTATQFGKYKYPKVLITVDSPKSKQNMWKGGKEHSSVSDLVADLKKHGWHQSAIPT